MTSYTPEEYADMLICYGYCDCVSAQARNEYITRYPGRRVPDVAVFDRVYRRLRETGSILRRSTDMGRPRIDDNEEQDPNDLRSQDVEKKTDAESCQQKTNKRKRKRPVKNKKSAKRLPKEEIVQISDPSESESGQVLPHNMIEIDIINHEDYKIEEEESKAKTKTSKGVSPKGKKAKTPKSKIDEVVQYIDSIGDIENDFGNHVVSLIKELPQKEKRKLHIDIIRLIFKARAKQRQV